MSQRLVVEKKCERCPRVERHEISVAAVKKTGFSLDEQVQSIKVEVDGAEIGKFGYLCTTCREIVTDYALAIFRDLSKVSAHRKKKVDGDDEPEIEVEDVEGAEDIEGTEAAE